MEINPKNAWYLNSVLSLWERHIEGTTLGDTPQKPLTQSLGDLSFKKRINKEIEGTDLRDPNKNYNSGRERGMLYGYNGFGIRAGPNAAFLLLAL